jgi:hypothetical protein
MIAHCVEMFLRHLTRIITTVLQSTNNVVFEYCIRLSLMLVLFCRKTEGKFRNLFLIF